MKATLVILLILFASAARGATHSNTITFSQGGTSVPLAQQCNNITPCTMQLYSLKGQCPSSVSGGTWTQLTSTQTGTTSANGSTFSYTDPTVSGQVTCYYATVTFTSGGAASLPSNLLFLTTPTDPPAQGTLSGVAN